jgi:hypothetical protein
MSPPASPFRKANRCSPSAKVAELKMKNEELKIEVSFFQKANPGNALVESAKRGNSFLIFNF